MTARGFQIFAPFTKVSEQDDGSLLVHSIINDETIDDQGEQVAYEAVKDASADYMKWAAVREMHGDSAAGSMVSLTHDDATRTTEGIIRVVDPVAIQKVQTGVYKGTSLGGRKRERVMAKVAGRDVARLTKIDWIETSLVDRPSRPTAVLTLLKRAEGAEGDADMSTTATAAEAVIDTPATELDPLEKAAADDLTSVHIAKEQIAHLIEKESAEGDTDQVGPLKAALAALDAFETSEAEELGTEEDTAQAAEEDAEAIPVVFAYAAVTADLAKRAADLHKAGKRNAAKDQQNLEQIHDLAVAAGAYPDDHGAKADDTAETDTEGEDTKKAATATPIVAGQTPDEFVDGVMERLGKSATFVRTDDLLAMKGELLGALRPIQEELAKVAAQPASGGPLRYATDPRGLYGPAAQTPADTAIATVLAKVSDPNLREELGRALAAQEIAAARG